MSQRDVRAYLFDIAEACRLVLEFTRTRSAGDYATDPMLRSAVERQLEIMGEALAQALRHHPGLLAGRIPEAPRIIAFRNQLVPCRIGPHPARAGRLAYPATSRERRDR